MNQRSRYYYNKGRQLRASGGLQPTHDGTIDQQWLVAGWHDEDMVRGGRFYFGAERRRTA